MTTRVIGIKEFRQNLTRFAKAKNMRFIVMHHSVPVMKVEPIDEDELILEKFADQIERGLRDAARGKVISSTELRKRLKL
ncbi:MAG: hypothetical protein PHX93_04040 [Candidatus Peribacteraceae bacterium]|jgi:predicted transcriptional regulator|nr:hypothetical protein [Candidatus Peribacteraceae bacterium]